MTIGIIGGTGALELFPTESGHSLTTPFGAPSARPERAQIGAQVVWVLARHGKPHRIPPHRINYRANLHALKSLGVEGVIAINAVGAIDQALPPGALVVPDQLIDYTWGREHTFSGGGSSRLNHVEFAKPFAGRVREALLAGAARAGVELTDTGCLGVTQGPRLETAAEVGRLAADGCTLVGMTAMPEAALARELGMDYASLCVVANPAADGEQEPISIDRIHQVLTEAMDRVRNVIESAVPLLHRH